ncbi:hypothetical protein HK100_001328 [Physocladia obscura]|uniref:Amino acid permease/ SLC12A domain-containing protein n=1 Tax=Physocladia obscura TaxID=109957 RepID=A0AAD5SZI8_9FUNG|nr:hypothetical protein HK100_001328 [Physocladia obscura]
MADEKKDPAVLEELAIAAELADAQNSGKRLHRGLETRHLQMIALGGTIGTGLFVSSGSTIAVAGPLGVLIAYILVGILVYAVGNPMFINLLTVVAIGEMCTQVPVSGAFGEIATRFLDPSVGFALGWNYYFQWLLTIPAELSTFGTIAIYWAPDSQPWIYTLIALILLIAFNFLGVKAYGEVEYWLSMIKVASVSIFILIAFAIVCGANHDLGAVGFSNWNPDNNPGAPVVSFLAILSCFTNAFYSYGGSELIGVTAGEAKNPSVSVPRAIKGTFWRILLFYILSLLFIGMIIPMSDPELADTDIRTSPFTRVLQYAGIGVGADIMNAVILLSVFSAGNGAIYASSRTLQNIAANGMAPAIFSHTTSRGVPIVSMVITSLVGSLALIGAYVGNGIVYNFLLNVLSISGLITWLMVLVTHLNFRWAWRAQGRRDEDLIYKAPWFPYFDFIGLFIGVFVLAYFIYNATLSDFDVVYDSPFYAGLPLFIVPLVAYKIYSYATTGKLAFGVDRLTVDFDTNKNGGVYETVADEKLELEGNQSIWAKLIRAIA